MILDWNDSQKLFFLRVPRGQGINIQELKVDFGLDFSLPASTPQEAVLFTAEPYAAAAFAEYATPAALTQIQGIVDQVEASWKPVGEGHFRCPADQELWPFQKADLEYALARDHALIGDEPGLGKTPTAICWANELQSRRTLVVCPANIRLQWQKKIYEWATNPWPYHVHPILDGRHGVHPTAAWTVVSYDLARTPAIGKALAEQQFDAMILDEAHYVKTIDSKRTRAIFGGGEKREFVPLFTRASHTLALTGTPLPNRPREAYTLARGLCWDSIGWLSEDAFRDRFNPSIKRDVINPLTGRTKVYVDERTGRHAELQNRLRANFMVRHLKRTVMPQLKLPIYDLVLMEETRAVKQALEAERLLDIDPENLAGADAVVLGHIAAVRKQMGVAIAPQVADYAAMLLDGGEDKLVLFGWHIEVLNIWMDKLARFNPVRIDGSTAPEARQNKVNAFINDPDVRIIVGNLQSMGVGVDGLQHVCSHALLAEPSWTPSDNIQAFDRLDRGGQTRQVQADILVAPGSIAERILAASLRKGHTVFNALDRRV